MKLQLFFFLLASNVCFAQNWMGEVMVGTSAYNGDLTEQAISLKRLFPAVGVNLKYNTGDFIDFRIGLNFEKVGADDKDNKNPYLQKRNLNFKTSVLEFNACVELNLIDPSIYDQYPYIFAGIGFFHFNPYTTDDNGKKTYLNPLDTEGEGLPDYPSRKNYSLTQPCIPIGAGLKWKVKEGIELAYEFGYRILFTDYLDDVSKTYVSIETLSLRKGPEAAELSYRKVNTPFTEEGYPRGNPKVKDYYFFTGLKVSMKFGK
ncbi:MAG TPA: DUF6089 family protein [Chitinophagaceae bacterium]